MHGDFNVDIIMIMDGDFNIDKYPVYQTGSVP